MARPDVVTTADVIAHILDELGLVRSRIAELENSRETSLARTRIEEGEMWLSRLLDREVANEN